MKKKIWGILQASFYLLLFVIFIYSILNYKDRYWRLICGVLGLPFGLFGAISDIKAQKRTLEDDEEEEIIRANKRLGVWNISKAIGLVIISIFSITFFCMGY
ncbi:hypothetical protein LQZ19_02865 [Treponema primitia]|uniref:hypothetical protein n=1 Tax=Treponema primitia TaxID=88058 RepID=UPI00397F0FEB